MHTGDNEHCRPREVRQRQRRCDGEQRPWIPRGESRLAWATGRGEIGRQAKEKGRCRDERKHSCFSRVIKNGPEVLVHDVNDREKTQAEGRQRTRRSRFSSRLTPKMVGKLQSGMLYMMPLPRPVPTRPATRRKGRTAEAEEEGCCTCSGKSVSAERVGRNVRRTMSTKAGCKRGKGQRVEPARRPTESKLRLGRLRPRKQNFRLSTYVTVYIRSQPIWTAGEQFLPPLA